MNSPDRYVLSTVHGYRITTEGNNTGSSTKRKPPYEVSVLDTAYCHQVVGSFAAPPTWRTAMLHLPMIEAKRLCDRLNAQERLWERETSG